MNTLEPFDPEALQRSISDRQQAEYVKKFFSAKKWYLYTEENTVVLSMQNFNSVQYNLSAKIQSPALKLLIESLGNIPDQKFHDMMMELFREIIEAGIEKVSR